MTARGRFLSVVTGVIGQCGVVWQRSEQAVLEVLGHLRTMGNSDDERPQS